eukprot:CAMPEP_0177411478 /NCGR_PEP_ID=MMETSP0368-20130122/65438_1 /TAXON_ID=447022 ORGANISM="Scrippsiella hangoei-like, Strain SHHI-4" /NCGR_SAMPLE_ID=MMETSP0368 /ASSEMBLY_ACC=CAM_ASM_000363 /LENGTH=45 /DNA_ID= /DNA_START= /DNA_END= /DNA_ORIENTATION=
MPTIFKASRSSRPARPDEAVLTHTSAVLTRTSAGLPGPSELSPSV